jgi:subtilisin family serine protease
MSYDSICSTGLSLSHPTDIQGLNSATNAAISPTTLLSDPLSDLKLPPVSSSFIPDNAGNALTTALDIGVLNTLQTFNDYVGLGDPNDFYRFQVSTTSSITINLSNLSADADFQLIKDSNNNGIINVGEIIAYPWQFGTLSETLTVSLDPGTYYIRVFPYSGSTNYTLAASATPITLPSGYSPSYGYGLVDAAAAVTAAVNQTSFASVPNLEGNNWNLDAINAPEVWAQGFTGQNIVVAVLDTGVDYLHPDLNDNIWQNPGEIAGNGIDDDANGFIDDVLGWDFAGNDNNPMDLDGHGTHVAGTIAAENNGFGATGVAYNATIMPVQVLGADGSGSYSNVAAGVLYAVDNGADIINLSLGGGSSPELTSAIQYAQSQGVVVVIASGNEGSSQPGFPANLASQFGIAVGAVNRSNQLASFSNDAGFSPVDYVVAPGVNVFSTVPGNRYDSYNGTSMATPHVAGVAALMLSANPLLSPQQVINLLTNTASPNKVVA